MKLSPMPEEPTLDMVNAAYTLLETMKSGTPERHKRIVREVWRVMAEARPQPPMTGLSKKQQQVHEIIADWVNDHGRVPKFEEIAAQMGTQKSNVHYLVKHLIRRGVVSMTGNRMQLLIQPGEPVRKR